MKKLLAALLLALSIVPAGATQKTTSQLTTDNTTNFPDNRTGAITPAVLRNFHKDVIDSFVAIYTITGAAPSNNWVNGFDSAGAPTFAQPLFSNLGGSVACAQMPTLSGDVTSLLCATTISTNAVTYGKFQQVAASSLVGNPTGALANAQGITLGATLAFSGTALQTAALTGDVTASANSFATTIGANAVTNAKAAQMATNTVKANATSGTANAADFAMPSCSAATEALKWTTNTGFGCNTAINASTLGGATFAAPGSIGSGTPAAGAFTTLSASSTVSGAGFSAYLASPPAIGGTAAAAGAFTTLSASSTVSGTGFSDYLASPPAIGGTAPAAVKATTLWATGHVFTTGTAPSLSSCGTSPSIDSNSTDVAGKITVGSGAGTVCTLTFASGFTTAPFCIVLPITNGTAFALYTATTTTLPLTNLVSSQSYNYLCVSKS
jgi:hypothetical protein